MNFNYNPADEYELEQRLGIPAGLCGRMPIMGTSCKKQAFSSREGLVPIRSRTRQSFISQMQIAHDSNRPSITVEKRLVIPSRFPSVLHYGNNSIHSAPSQLNPNPLITVAFDPYKGAVLRGSVNAAPPQQKYRILPSRGIYK